MSKKEKAGTIGWIDLTVENANEIRDFYKKVTGWKSTPVSMGAYNDYNMNSTTKGPCCRHLPLTWNE